MPMVQSYGSAVLCFKIFQYCLLILQDYDFIVVSIQDSILNCSFRISMFNFKMEA